MSAAATQAGRWASRFSSKAIEAKSDYPQPYVLRGYIRKTRHDLDGAMSDFSRALDLTGANWCDCYQKKSSVLRDRAGLKEEKGDVDGSIADYSAAIATLEADGGKADSLYMSRADAKKKKGDLDGAIADVTTAMGHGYGLSGYRRRADLRKEKGDVDGAIADRSSAIRLTSAAEDYRGRSDLKKGKGDLDGAIVDLTYALLAEPCSAEAYHSRSLARAAKGDTAGAQSDEAEATKIQGHALLRGGSLLGLGENLCELGMTGNSGIWVPGKGALVEVPGAGVLSRDEPVVKSFRGKKEGDFIKSAQASASKGDHGAAVFDLTQAVKLELDNPIPYALRGVERMNIRDNDGAIADLGEAIRISERRRLAITAGMYFNRGLAESTVGDLQGAVRDFSKTLEIEPRDAVLRAAAYNGRGKAKWALPHSQGDDLDSIIDDFTKAIQLKPEVADEYNGRSLARRAKGDAPGADEDSAAASRLKATPKGQQP